MRKYQIPAGNRHAFMLIELIAVLMMMAILCVFILSRDPDNSIKLSAESDILRSHLRYVRNLALSDDSGDWQFELMGTNAYKLTDNNSGDVLLPGESSAVHTLPDAFTLEISRDDGIDPGGKIVFDSWGSPPGGTGYSLTLTDSSSGKSRIIRIVKHTGFVK